MNTKQMELNQLKKYINPLVKSKKGGKQQPQITISEINDELIKEQIKHRSLTMLKKNLSNINQETTNNELLPPEQQDNTPPSLSNIPSSLQNTPRFSNNRFSNNNNSFFPSNEFKCMTHDSDFCLIQALVKDMPLYECTAAEHQNQYQCHELTTIFSDHKFDYDQVQNMGELINKVEIPVEDCQICQQKSLQPINSSFRNLLAKTFLTCKHCGEKIVKKNYIEHCNAYCQMKAQPQDYKYEETLEFFSPIVKAIQRNEKVLEKCSIDEVRDFLHQTKKKLKFKNQIPFLINDTQNYSCLLPRNMDQLSIQIGNYVIIMFQIYDKKPKKSKSKQEKKQSQKLQQNCLQVEDDYQKNNQNSMYSFNQASSKEDSELYKNSFEDYTHEQELYEQQMLPCITQQFAPEYQQESRINSVVQQEVELIPQQIIYQQ